MIRKKLRQSLALPCLAACIVLVLAGCDRSGSATDTEASPVDDAPSIVDESTPAPAPEVSSAGPTVLTELEGPSRSTVTTESGLCSIDKLNGQVIPPSSTFVVEDPATLVVAGWVGNKATMTRPPARLRISLADGTRSWEVTAGPPKGRGDVAGHYGNDGMRDAGFEVAVDASALPPGEYRLSLVHEADGRTYVCDKDSRIRIGA